VSQLFRGYDKLILGFNTFLPEGYKIELPHVEGAEATMTVITPSGVTASTSVLIRRDANRNRLRLEQSTTHTLVATIVCYQYSFLLDL